MFLDKLHQRAPGMPHSQRQVAAYFCSHLERASYQTIAQIASATGVSETTVVRLAYAMDYSSFSEMQKDIRHDLLTGQTVLDGTCPQKEQDFYGYLMRHEVDGLQQTMRMLDRNAMDQAVELLCKADRVYLMGNRSSAAACAWFLPNMSMVRPNVFQVRDVSDMIDITYKSVAVVVAYHPYARDTVVIARHLKQQGCKLICITDSFLSPIAELGDVVVLTGGAKSDVSFCNAITGPVAVMNIMLIGMVRKMPEAKERIHHSKEIRAYFNAVTETDPVLLPEENN